MVSNPLGLLKRYPVLTGFLLMFVCTWPIDLWAAANSHGLLLSLPIPSILPLFVGYGFVVASLFMTGVIRGTMKHKRTPPLLAGATKWTTMVVLIAGLALATVYLTQPPAINAGRPAGFVEVGK